MAESEVITFNLQDILNVTDIDEATFKKHGETLFPDYFKKLLKKERQNAQRSD